MKVFANFLFDFFGDLKNSTSCEYRNKLAKSGEQFVPMGMLINCRKISYLS